MADALCSWVPHSRVQPAEDRKYFLKICVYTQRIQFLPLSFLPKEHRITIAYLRNIYIVLGDDLNYMEV